MSLVYSISEVIYVGEIVAKVDTIILSLHYVTFKYKSLKRRSLWKVLSFCLQMSDCVSDYDKIVSLTNTMPLVPMVSTLSYCRFSQFITYEHESGL